MLRTILAIGKHYLSAYCYYCCCYYQFTAVNPFASYVR